MAVLIRTVPSQCVDSKRLNWSHTHTLPRSIEITTLFYFFCCSCTEYSSLSNFSTNKFMQFYTRIAKSCIFYTIECKQQAVHNLAVVVVFSCLVARTHAYSLSDRIHTQKHKLRNAIHTREVNGRQSRKKISPNNK